MLRELYPSGLGFQLSEALPFAPFTETSAQHLHSVQMLCTFSRLTFFMSRLFWIKKQGTLNRMSISCLLIVFCFCYVSLGTPLVEEEIGKIKSGEEQEISPQSSDLPDSSEPPYSSESPNSLELLKPSESSEFSESPNSLELLNSQESPDSSESLDSLELLNSSDSSSSSDSRPEVFHSLHNSTSPVSMKEPSYMGLGGRLNMMLASVDYDDGMSAGINYQLGLKYWKSLHPRFRLNTELGWGKLKLTRFLNTGVVILEPTSPEVSHVMTGIYSFVGVDWLFLKNKVKGNTQFQSYWLGTGLSYWLSYKGEQVLNGRTQFELEAQNVLSLVLSLGVMYPIAGSMALTVEGRLQNHFFENFSFGGDVHLAFLMPL